ncbi:mycofactocin biosynthesis peptidyl-dipeptidase MftE [Gordonia soli]|uniref:Creatininase family protein n=1 Tax=Gordonia soli NBRC 108243 TaxID=1223545 RepID=M0QJZ4_9ACTN|nr:mycofactocin biosynthesis peptidyl-dipeptidase MftE [Gordonia soli]GAC67762.1 creatininase family protein [Gordonia soli NBRC 108243]
MTRPAALGQLSWPELDGSTVTLLVPLGAVEQHGPHLPLDTDSRIATAVAEGAHDRLLPSFGRSAGGSSDAMITPPRFLVAPPLHYGASGEHEAFAGTVSLGAEALGLLLLEYGRSACRWADRIVFVNGHGGNGRPLVDAVGRLRGESRDVAWFPCVLGGRDAHAGHTETSVLMHISPELVRSSHAAAGNRQPVAQLLPELRAGGVAAVSPNGVLGDPTGATAAEGRTLLESSIDALVAAVGEWSVDAQGRLV